MCKSLETFKDTYRKARPTIAVLLVISLSLSTLFPDYPKAGLFILLGITLLLILFDYFNEIKTRLDAINQNLKLEAPLSFDKFTEILPEIEKILIKNYKEKLPVHIKILAVSAQFSWKNLIEETIPKFLKPNGSEANITVDILVVKPEVLINWGQKGLALHLKRNYEAKPILEQKCEAAIRNGKFKLNIFEYDNIPHWHGFLINDELLFMGRCEWDLDAEKKELLAGQKEYVLYKKDDRFYGCEQIKLFENWFEIYKMRSNVINKVNFKPPTYKQV